MTKEKPELKYTLIENEPDFAKAISKLEREKIIAFDLEADNMFHFKEKVCLIQIAVPRHIFIVDPLKLNNLELLKPVFSDPGIKKVFHGADFDVRSLYRDFNIEIHNLFDTEIACRFLGRQETGLDATIKDRFGVVLDKKFQKKDWSQRPLTKEMMAYAAGDVYYLIPLAKFLEKELRAKGRLNWVREECALLSKVRHVSSENNPLFVKCKGAGRLDRRSLGVLEALLHWRIKIASKKDRPLFKILSNNSLMVIAKRRPLKREQLSRLNVLSRKQVDMYGDAIIKVVHQAGGIEESQLPEYPRHETPRLKPATQTKIKKLKKWRDAKAKEFSIDPALLLNKATMTAIAQNKLDDIESLRALAELKEWQVMQFGRDILRILNISSGAL